MHATSMPSRKTIFHILPLRRMIVAWRNYDPTVSKLRVLLAGIDAGSINEQREIEDLYIHKPHIL
jgi:hypothetical protein